MYNFIGAMLLHQKLGFLHLKLIPFTVFKMHIKYYFLSIYFIFLFPSSSSLSSLFGINAIYHINFNLNKGFHVRSSLYVYVCVFMCLFPVPLLLKRTVSLLHTCTAHTISYVKHKILYKDGFKF